MCAYFCIIYMHVYIKYCKTFIKIRTKIIYSLFVVFVHIPQMRTGHFGDQSISLADFKLQHTKAGQTQIPNSITELLSQDIWGSTRNFYKTSRGMIAF